MKRKKERRKKERKKERKIMRQMKKGDKKNMSELFRNKDGKQKKDFKKRRKR